MKKVTVDDSIFSQKDLKEKGKSAGKKSTQNKKKKGEDFLDYANKNGIELNLQYEDKVNKEDKYKLNKANPKQLNNSQPYKQEKPTGGNNFKAGFKTGYNRKPQQHKKNFRTGNNKFDQCNMHLSKVMPMMSPLYNPYTLQGYGMPNMMNQGGYNSAPININQYPLPEVDPSNAESIVNFIECYLSLENLNQDLYLRNRIDENGYMEVSEIANHNRLKYKGITPDVLVTLFFNNDNPTVECMASGPSEVFLRNRDWNNLIDKLIPKEIISQNKRALKQQAYSNPMNMNYVSLQNNYFFNAPASDLSAMYMGYQYPMGGMNMIPMGMQGINPINPIQMSPGITPMNSMNNNELNDENN